MNILSKLKSSFQEALKSSKEKCESIASVSSIAIKSFFSKIKEDISSSLNPSRFSAKHLEEIPLKNLVNQKKSSKGRPPEEKSIVPGKDVLTKAMQKEIKETLLKEYQNLKKAPGLPGNPENIAERQLGEFIAGFKGLGGSVEE